MQNLEKKDFIKKLWKSIEKNKKPKELRKIRIIASKTFFELFSKPEKNKSKIMKLIKNLYSGDPYIIKGAISKKYIEFLKSELINVSKNDKPRFFKMNKKCPNFWRRIDEKIAKKYSVVAVRDSYYFFRWNKDKLKIWKNFDTIWSLIKKLGGLEKNSFLNNLPKDGVVDRVQIVRYPENSGFIEPHYHDPANQRIIISIYMSKKGVDYSSGGTYFFKGRKKINIEDFIEKGDVGIFYATMKHAVNPVKSVKKSSNKNYSGRWWCGLYSPESDLVKNRNTSSPLSK